jgi:hypothetical protein
MRSSTNNKAVNKKQKAGGKPVKFILLAAFCLFLSAAYFFGTANKPKPGVYIQKSKDSHYRLIVDGKPFIVKGVCYNPVPVGQNHEYDWWSDPAKPWLIDGKLMKEMGINTIRVYQPGVNPESVKQVVRDLYNLYGIHTAFGSWLGFWEYPCPFYADKDFRQKVIKEVLDMVSLYKDEPGVLMWILGNENNYSFSGRVNPWSSEEIDKEPDLSKRRVMRAEVYYSLANEIAKEIHKIDPRHPVALGNGELISLDTAAGICPDIDLIACIIYRGKSFGNLFNSLRSTFDKPVILSEFGADAYNACLQKEDDDMQAFFLEAQWRQIYANLAGNKKGAGNCLGGIMFEWSDEWWKHNENDPEGWKAHDTSSNWSNPSYYIDIQAQDNKNMNEEWFGIIGLSQEQENGLNKRIPRKSYYKIKDFWNNPDIQNKPKAQNKKSA